MGLEYNDRTQMCGGTADRRWGQTRVAVSVIVTEDHGTAILGVD